MRKLILVKHAAPVIAPGVPPEKWVLSAAGKHQAAVLADVLLPMNPGIVVASLEPKAAETAEIIAVRAGVAFESRPGLQEHDRSNVPHMPSRDFISMVELFFRQPGKLVLGRESADEAIERFEAAVDQTLAAYPDGNVTIVSHGTVLALYLARRGGGNGFTLWRKLGLPSYAVLSLPDGKISQIVERIG